VNYTEEIVIIGGGMVGRVAQRYMPDALILDWGPPPVATPRPQTFGAIYWWEPVADLPCVQFQVLTTIDGETPTPEGIRAYKERVGKGFEVQTRPDAVARQFQPLSHGYAPTSFPAPTRIMYRARVERIDPDARMLHMANGDTYLYSHLVSTIPLPALLKMFPFDAVDQFEHIEFRSRPIFVTVAPDDHEARTVLQVNYSTTRNAYRETRHLDGSTHREYASAPMHTELPVKKLVPGRIYDVPQAAELLLHLRGMAIHSFGRYGRWDSDELLHMTDAQLRTFASLL